MTKIFKVLGAIASILFLSVAVASAQDAAASSAPAKEAFTIQLEEKDIPVGDFNALNISGDFEVTLDKGECGVRLTVDNALSPYVQVYVRAKTLYIAYDEKSVPKDVKKLYKGKGVADPTFRAIIHIPELNSLFLADNATISSAGEFNGEFFQLNLADKAQVKSLSVKATSANIALAKNSQAVISINADDKIDITNEGNTNIKLSAVCSVLNVTGQGNSTISVGAESPTVNVNVNNNSKVAVASKAEKVSVSGLANGKAVLTGQAESLSVKTDKNSEVEADVLSVKSAIVNMAGSSKATVNASETIEASLIGGSSLFYNGNPTFKIGKIVKSTLAPKGALLK